MIRWPLFVVGLVLMVCAGIAKFQQAPLPTEARPVSVADAMALVGDSAKHFVELPAQVDTTRRVYSTGSEVSRPVYTANPPDQVYPITVRATTSEWEPYLGNMVRVEARPESHHVRLQTVRDRTFEEKQIVRERLLVPVHGSEFRLWALSAAFPADAPEGAAWLEQRQLQGYLIRFKDVEANRTYPKFEHNVEEISRFVEKEFGKAIPEDAFVLLTDFKSFPQPVNHFYCPIQGSQDTLFYPVTPATVTNLPPVLRGVLEPSALDLYGDFEKVLNAKLPPRIGILTPESAATFNQRRATGIRDFLAAGGGLASLGFVGIVWKRLRKPGKRAKA